ncbi:MAG: ankyrin repeat domain-containing protein, partial [Gammaproteobacteria bacterium]|nr:ankyrin repeat domain-containing protein [Gammaproteobacteria bacterium]
PIDLSLLKQMLQLKDIDTQTMVPKIEGYTSHSMPLLSFLLAFPEKYDAESIELLVKAGADVNQPDERGIPPFIYAMRNKWGIEIVSLFINNGLDVCSVSIPAVSPIGTSKTLDQKWTYFMHAMRLGRLDILEALLRQVDPARVQASLNLRCPGQDVPYSIWTLVIQADNLNALQILLQYATPTWTKAEKEFTKGLLGLKAPEIASEFWRLLFGSEHFVQNDPTAYLFKYFYDLLQNDKPNIIEKIQIESLLMLIETTIDDENKFQDCLSSIMLLKIPAPQKERLLNQLAHCYKNFDFIYKDGSTPLRWAIVNNLEPEARWLLDNGADPNFVSTDSPFSPLVLTIIFGSDSLVSLLLKQPKILLDKMEPFMYAARQGKLDILQTLVQHPKNTLGLRVFNQAAPTPFQFQWFISYSQEVYGSSTCTLYGAAIYSGSFKTFSYVVENMTDKSALSAELHLMLIVVLNRTRMLSHLIGLEKKAEFKPIRAVGTALIAYATQLEADDIARLVKDYLRSFAAATTDAFPDSTDKTVDSSVESPFTFFRRQGLSNDAIKQLIMAAKQTKQKRKHGLQVPNFFKGYQVTPPQAEAAGLSSWFRGHIDNMHHQPIKLVENADVPTYIYCNYAPLGLSTDLLAQFDQVKPRFANQDSGSDGIYRLHGDIGNVSIRAGGEIRNYPLCFELKIKKIERRLFGVAIPADEAHNRSALIVFCFSGKALHTAADAERLRERVKTTKQNPIEVIKLINDDEYDVAGPPPAVLV